MFWIAVIPGLMAVALLMGGVKEPRHPDGDRRTNPIRRENLRRFDASYWWVVGVGAVFMLARFSEAFLVLRAQQVGVPIALVPLMIVAMNVVYAGSAYPFGWLSDRMSHAKLLVLGLAVLVAGDIALAIRDDWSTVMVGVALWGVHLGMTQGLLATMVADAAPADLRGSAFGLFNMVSGLSMLLASCIAGLLWDQFGPSQTFYAGAAFCLIAMAAVGGQPRKQSTETAQ